MLEIELTQFGEEGFVIHFGKEGHKIDALTLGNSLVRISRMTKIICRKKYPDLKFDIVVGPVGSGSFRAQCCVLLAVMSPWLVEVSTSVVSEALWAYILKMSSVPNSEQIIDRDDYSITLEYEYEKIIDNKKDTVTEREKRRVKMPFESYEVLKDIDSNKQMKGHLDSFIKSVHDDPAIEALGVCTKLDDEDPILSVPRSDFPAILKHPVGDQNEEKADVDEREVEATVNVAVFRDPERKWEFMLDGKKKSAPVTDQNFLLKLKSGEISLGMNDVFDARVKVYKKRDPKTGNWVDDKFEIVELRLPPRQNREIIPWIDDNKDR